MTAKNLSRVATDVIQAYGITATNVINTYRYGGERIMLLANVEQPSDTEAVFASGADYTPPSPGPGPALAEVNAQIARANAAAGDPATSRVGWLDAAGGGHGLPDRLDFGDANDGKGLELWLWQVR